MKPTLIHAIVECHFKNTNIKDRRIVKKMFKKLNINDLENLDLYLDEIKNGDRFGLR